MTSTTTTTTTTTAKPLRSRPSLLRFQRGPSSSASTPNLNAIYSLHSKLVPRGLTRQTSLAALTPSSLASIPDVSESYAFDTVLSDTSHNMAPGTPGSSAAEDLNVGDAVDVPGGLFGTVRFVGAVQGKKGVFAGVELHPDFSSRGKNNGDVDGVSYFTTTVPGSGIFVPVTKALRRGSPLGSTINSFPMTPTPNAGQRHDGSNGTNFTPPGLPKFSASIGPGVKAPSPSGRRPRTSLPRPDSPVRRTQMTPGPRPSIGTPAPKPPARYGSPTNRFAQSVRGTAGDPNKKPSMLDRKPSFGPRSVSALGAAPGADDEPRSGSPQRRGPNGLSGSASVMNLRRPASRANAANDDEIERLRAQLEDRDRQLKEQSSTLAEMESSLVELQGLIEQSDGPKMGRNSLDEKDSAQLRQMLREKNDKIAMLTSEFDAHRADFRSTIDTLELASTETERVYEKRIEELMGDVRELEARNLDVDSVASQLRQLEELVQELEEGLEDARRGEAEARGEAEFLRGEVERTKTELRRERDKAGPNGTPQADRDNMSKELEQKEDEIRGLKAIIHSLSRDSLPDTEDRTPTHRPGSFISGGGDGASKAAREALEKQIAELQETLSKKSHKERELEQELESLRRGGNAANAPRRNSTSARRNSHRDSRDTVIPVRVHEPRAQESNHKRANTLDTMHESDTYSTATENSTLWCEICETSGHDILTCTNMFGPDGGAKSTGDAKTGKDAVREGLKPQGAADDAHPAPLAPAKPKTPVPNGAPPISILPNPMESGPVAGKESGVMDPEKWCAICERDGHDSVDCPFEDAL